MLADRQLVDIREFAKIAGLSQSTVRRRIKDGSIAALQPGGPGTAWRIPADLAQAFRDASDPPDRNVDLFSQLKIKTKTQPRWKNRRD